MVEVKRIGLVKHFILSFLTLTLYNYWWVYKTWLFFKEKEKSDINPALRTIFSTVFLIPLFYRVEKEAVSNKVARILLSVFLFAGILFFSLLAYLPAPSSFVYLFSIVFFIQPVIVFNLMLNNCEDVTVIEQTSYNWKQIILLVFGGLFWGLILLTIIVKLFGMI